MILAILQIWNIAIQASDEFNSKEEIIKQTNAVNEVKQVYGLILNLL